MKLRVLSLFAVVAVPAFAQLQPAATANPSAGFTREPAAAEKPRVLGWNKAANLGVNLAFTSSQNVVGQADGSSQTYGLNFKGNLNREGINDEWRNSLGLVESTTRVPNIDSYIKSNDELKIDTMYMYSIPSAPDFGPYVRGEASAPIFVGQDVRATPQTYSIVRNDGVPNSTFTGSALRLTDGFRPLNTKESIGGFWKAVQQEECHLEFRLGFAGLQINAAGQYAVHGTNAEGALEIDELSNVNQAGVEAAMGVKGKINDNSGYEAALETLTPFINNKPAGDNRSAVDLTNYDGFIKLTSNITKWAAFAYDYKFKIEPQLIPGAQQVHMLTLNINYNLL